MSVIVKGMKMPKFCFSCDFCFQDQDSEHDCTWRCAALEQREISYFATERSPSCPLAEVKHGKWIPQIYAKYECSVCGFYETTEPYDYCPHCGAVMDKEEYR